MSKKKYSKEFKLQLIRKHIDEGISRYQLEKENGLCFGMIRDWLDAYEARGEDGLEKHNSMNYRYSAEFKQRVINEYLAGGISMRKLAKKHGILAESTVLKWIKQYNNHEELTNSRPEGERYLMAKDIKSRKTTQKERVAIVEFCMAHSNNYALAAKEFNCSYDQVYTWVKKYKEKGIDGLVDRRGRSKPEEELSEVEKLNAENRILKAEMKKQQMEIDLLKKLEDIERR